MPNFAERTAKPMRSSSAALYLTLFLVAVPVAIQPPARAQTPAAASAQTEQKTFAYDVVSIKPNKSAEEASGWRSASDGSIVITNAPLGWLVRNAFGVIIDDQLSGLPGWVNSDRYDVQAKMDEDSAAAWNKITGEAKKQQQQLLYQSLLADRCHLKVHRETRQLPVYDLVIAKGGLKLQDAKPIEGSRTTAGNGLFNAQAITIEALAYSLSGDVGRVILDKTGLGDKKFDLDLKWTPDEQQGTADAGPSLFAAIEEQLGLKLVSSRGPVETVVVDHMEKPSEN